MPRRISADFALKFLPEDTNVHRMSHAGTLRNSNLWVYCRN